MTAGHDVILSGSEESLFRSAINSSSSKCVTTGRRRWSSVKKKYIVERWYLAQIWWRLQAVIKMLLIKGAVFILDCMR
jgi:hypothetical protein